MTVLLVRISFHVTLNVVIIKVLKFVKVTVLRYIIAMLYYCTPGGYDRGECLNTVEMYNVDNNTWEPLKAMISPRGRFDVSQLQGKLFSCGGSDGSAELKSCEYYDPEEEKWFPLPEMTTSRSSPGRSKGNGYCFS